jgi:hypothetical protein
MTAIDASLVAAYQRTNYVVFEEQRETCLRIGVSDPEIDALLSRHGAEMAAVITAWNPASVILTAQENDARDAQLWQWIADHTLFALPAEGRDPTGDWQPEQSCFILDIAPDLAAELGRKFGQNAIVSVSRGTAPKLILLR